jgi:MoaA/NifB/PqqE/SkfB family radical SAM enzyme
MVSWKYIMETTLRAINLELTNRCNLRCDFCLNPSPAFRGKGVMTRAVLERIIEQAPASTAIHVCGIGEPTLHPEFPLMIRMLSDRFENMLLVTNGLDMDDSIMQCVLDSSISKILVSLDYFTEEAFRKHKKGGFSTVLGNINRLVRLRNEMNPSVALQVNMLMQDGSEREIADALEYFSNPDRRMIRDLDCVYSRMVKDLPGLNAGITAGTLSDWKHLPNLKNKLHVEGYDTDFLVVEDWLDTLGLDEPLSRRIPCAHPYSYCMVLWTGEVAACCVDFNGKLVMGDLTEESLRDIWTGDRYTRFRAAMERLDFTGYPLCADYREWYKCAPVS